MCIEKIVDRNAYSLSLERFIIMTRSKNELLQIYITRIYISFDAQNYFTSARYYPRVLQVFI